MTGEGSSGGKPVKIVYLLTIAGRASRQVARLVRQIYSPDHYILVHVDSRSDVRPDTGYINIFFLEFLQFSQYSEKVLA